MCLDEHSCQISFVGLRYLYYQEKLLTASIPSKNLEDETMWYCYRKLVTSNNIFDVVLQNLKYALCIIILEAKN